MFYQKKTLRKKSLQSKDLNIHHKLVSLKSKLIFQKKQYHRLNKAHRFYKVDDGIKQTNIKRVW